MLISQILLTLSFVNNRLVGRWDFNSYLPNSADVFVHE